MNQTLINIEFQDLCYTIPQGRKDSKLILKNVNGNFRCGQLTAILGPSGAGKSTLLNILAGYKSQYATGQILINGQQRDMKSFRNLSRYIMQEDVMQPMLTVKEAMLVAANLKLGNSISENDKYEIILEILKVLRLHNALNTKCTKLSGGEKKRLSIALELIDNPPVLFLDEPTTGLDDLSCIQCVSLLKQISQDGRTIICSIHTPSAKIFSIFDNVYIMSAGQCVYQGYGPDVVSFLSNDIGLECPVHFNPADFVIEIVCEEYGNYQNKLVSAIDNGRLTYKKTETNANYHSSELSKYNLLNFLKTKQGTDHNSEKSTWFMQYFILLTRMWIQMFRDKNYLALKIVLYLLVGSLVGSLYFGMGKDGSKTIFNFGFYFTCLIFFLYIPMMPVLVQFPRELQLIKREHFNKWYRFSAYFTALTTSTLPVQLILGSIYILLVYTLSDQPMELTRITQFYLICMLTGIISESFGLLVASQFSLVNGTFVGPVIAVPFILLAVYGFGSGYESIPTLIKIAMHFSFLRYSLEALIHIMLTDRTKLLCPDHEEFCIWTDLNYFMKDMGMDNTILWIDFTAMVLIYILFRGSSYYLLKHRLTPNRKLLTSNYVVRLVKSYFAR